MIKDGIYQSGEKSTPKKKAQDLILNKIAELRGYWTEDSDKTDGMTEREIMQVNEQLRKECDRIAKRFGYEESWVD